MILKMSEPQLRAIRRSLFRGSTEQAVFGFATWYPAADTPLLALEDVKVILPNDFEFQSAYHLWLRYDVQAELIRQAHIRALALIEFHSHRFTAGAQFSPSDLEGLSELAPHILWRLAGRPYLSLVFERHSFDALVWMTRGHKAVALSAIQTEKRRYIPTGLTLANLDESYERQI